MADITGISSGNGPPESGIDSRIDAVFSTVSSRNTSAVRVLLDTGIPVTTTNAQGESLLHVAASVGSVETASLLIVRGADVHSARADGRTPLAEAALQKHVVVERLLIAHGANVNSRSCNGETSLLLTRHGVTADAICHSLDAGVHTCAPQDTSERTDEDDTDRAGSTSAMNISDGDIHEEVVVSIDMADVISILVNELKHNSNVYVDIIADLEKVYNKSAFRNIVEKGLFGSCETCSRGVDRAGNEQDEQPLFPQQTVTFDSAEAQLMHACTMGDLITVKILLEQSVNVNIKCIDGYSPLHLAANRGLTDLLAMLIDYDANIEQVTEKERDSALGLAASAGRLEVAVYLIAENADLEHRNAAGYTPLCLAAESGQLEMIKLLLKKGADINSSTGSPDASCSGSKSSAKVRSSKNASKACPRGNQRCHKSSGRRGATPLMVAAINGCTEAARLLMDKGCDIHLQMDGNTALAMACRNRHHEVAKVILQISSTAAEHRSQNGYTLLMEAGRDGCCSIGKVLISGGAVVNATVSATKDTALMIAAEKGHDAFVKLLLKHGADVNYRNKRGCSALWIACHAGHTSIVRKLRSHKADLECRDVRGMSCLVAAFRQGCVSVVEYLVDLVRHFPSDDECSRHLAIVNDEVLLHRCQKSSELIKAARMRHENEAELNATKLLLEVEKEKSRVLKHRKAAVQQEKKKPQHTVTARRQVASESEHRQPLNVVDTSDNLEASLRLSSQTSVVGRSTLTLASRTQSQSSASCLESDVKPSENLWKTAGKSGHSKGYTAVQTFRKSSALLATSSSTLAKGIRVGGQTSAGSSGSRKEVGGVPGASGAAVEASSLVAAGGEEGEIVTKHVTVPPTAGAVLLSSKALAAIRQYSGAAIDVGRVDGAGALRTVSITGCRCAVRGARSVFAALVQNPQLSLDKQLSKPLSKRGRKSQPQRLPQQHAAQPLPAVRKGVPAAPSASVTSSLQLQPNPAPPGRSPSYIRTAAATVRSVGTSARAPNTCSTPASAVATSLLPTPHADAASAAVHPGAAAATPVWPTAPWSESGRRVALWRDVVVGAAVPVGRENAGRSGARELDESVYVTSVRSAELLSPATEGAAIAAGTFVADEFPVSGDPAAELPPAGSFTVAPDMCSSGASGKASVALEMIMPDFNADAASRATAEAGVSSAFGGLLPWSSDTSLTGFEEVMSWNAVGLAPSFEPEPFRRSGNWPARPRASYSYVGDRRATRPPSASDVGTSEAAWSGSSETSYWANDDDAHWEEDHKVGDVALINFRDYYGPHATKANALLNNLGSRWRVSQRQPAISEAAGDLPIKSLPAKSEFGGDALSPAIFGHTAFTSSASSTVPDFTSIWHSTNESGSYAPFASTSRSAERCAPFASTSRSAELSVGPSARGSLSTGGQPSNEASLAGYLCGLTDLLDGASSSQLLPSLPGDHGFEMQASEPVLQSSVSAIWGPIDPSKESHSPWPSTQKPPYSNQ